MIIKTSPDEIQNYLVDASNYKGSADAVYFPENEAEIKNILRECFDKKILVTISGNGTGLTGARVPEGGIVISTEKLNRIIEINETEKYAWVEPGCILSDLLKIFSEKKLLYPPDPTEKNCFIGGTAATNASGEKTFKYGPTRDYIMAMDVVLSNGESIKLSRGQVKAENYTLRLKSEEGTDYILKLPQYKMPPTKNTSGYFTEKGMDAIDLFIGSEGTLGVITKLKLKLLKSPADILSAVIFFNEEDKALDFIESARERSYCTRKDKTDDIDALALEYFDKYSLKFLSPDYPNISSAAKAAVWFEQELGTENEDYFIEKWSELISQYDGDLENSWFAFTETDKERIKGFRHSVSAKINEYISAKGLKKLGTDVAVPDPVFKEFYYFCKKEVETAGLDYVVYGHFGNSHIHLNMLPKNSDEIPLGKEVYKNICRRAAELGGTVSAEHGIGKIKPDYLLMMYSEDDIRKMAAVKKILDFHLILGIGNIIDKKYLS